MGLAKLIENDLVDTVLGIDVSTQSFAFCLYDRTGPVRWGEIKFEGKDVFARLADGQKKVAAMHDILKADLVVAEGAIYVQNKKTVILLAYSLGAIIAALYNAGSRVEEVSPMTWQRFIGNNPLTKEEKAAVAADNPDRSKVWYTAKYREIRKARTMAWVDQEFGIKANNDNVGDAVAIAHWAFEKHGKK